MQDQRKVYRGDRWALDRPDHIRGLTRDAFPPAPICYYRTLRCLRADRDCVPAIRNGWHDGERGTYFCGERNVEVPTACGPDLTLRCVQRRQR